MYKIKKDIGLYGNITLINEDTMSSLMIGRVSPEVIRIIEEEGYKFGKEVDGKLEMSSEWSLNVSEETAKTLARIRAMRMSKPVRIKKTEDKIESNKSEQNSKIDAMDVLLGLASYK